MAQRERESKRRKLIGFEKKKRIKLGLFIVSALATKIFIAIA